MDKIEVLINFLGNEYPAPSAHNFELNDAACLITLNGVPHFEESKQPSAVP
jgi:hypothetical protein